MNSININGILLTEVNRMREMMGVNLINEGWDDIVKKLLGVSDEATTVISKEIGDDPGKYSSKLASIVGGTGSISDITTYLSKQGAGSTSDDAIVAWIKTQPDILDQIAKSSDVVMGKASKIVYGKLKLANFLTQDTITLIDDLVTIPINKNRVDAIIADIDDVLKVLKNTPQRGNNVDLDTLIRQLEDKKKLSENYKSSMNNPTKVVDDIAGEVVDDFKVVMGKDDLLKFIDDEFPGNTAMKNDIGKISEVDLKKSQDEFNKLSDEEVDNAINKVCGTLKEGWFGSKFCDVDIKSTKEEIQKIKISKERNNQLSDYIESENRLRIAKNVKRKRFVKYLVVVGLGIGGIVGGVKAYDYFKGTCDKTENDFIVAIKSGFGDSYVETNFGGFDPSKCEGSYDGVTYGWDGSDWVQKK